MEVRAYEFDDFRVDAGEHALLQRGQAIPLTPKAFDTLRLLLEHHGRLVEKDAMMQRIWPDAVVEEANLANNISLLRKVLGDSGNRIQTVPRRGYRFTGEVRTIGDAPPKAEARRWWIPIAAVALVILGVAIGWLVAVMRARHEPPAFTQLTFRPGIVWGARFTDDGRTVVYAASHEGKPSELFLTRVEQLQSKPLGVAAGAVLSISRRGELAILIDSEILAFFPRGTLARLPLTGGAPRKIIENVQDADWSPDGEKLAVIRWELQKVRVEYPIGKTLFEAAPPAWISNLRVSPRGDAIAFLLHEAQRFDDRGRVIVIDANGHETRRSRVFTSANGLAWAPDGETIRITAADKGLNNGLVSIDRKGRDRVLANSPTRLMLFDVAPGGAALVALENDRGGIIARTDADATEREVSWLDGSWLRDISPDAKTILFDEEGTAGGETARVYTRPLDGGPAIDLGPGHAVAMSPDGKWVLARQRFTTPPRMLLIPTGTGQPRVFRLGNVESSERAAFLPDGRRLMLISREGQKPPRTWLYDLASDRIAPLTPEGTTGLALTPDGAFVIVRSPGNAPKLLPITGGEPHEIKGLTRKDGPLRFSADGKSLFITDADAMTVTRFDLASGTRELLWTYGAARPSTSVLTTPAMVAANGRAYAYTYVSETSDLFLVNGLD